MCRDFSSLNNLLLFDENISNYMGYLGFECRKRFNTHMEHWVEDVLLSHLIRRDTTYNLTMDLSKHFLCLLVSANKTPMLINFYFQYFIKFKTDRCYPMTTVILSTKDKNSYNVTGAVNGSIEYAILISIKCHKPDDFTKVTSFDSNINSPSLKQVLKKNLR